MREYKVWNRAKTVLITIAVIAACLTLSLSLYLKSYVAPTNPVTLTVFTDLPDYYVNKTIIIYFMLRNQNDSDVTFHFQSGYQIDYKIIQDSETIYTWSSDKGFTLSFTKIVIPAHGTVLEHLEHTPKDYCLKPGTYEILGFLNPYCGNYSDRTIITIHDY
jgi:hypothetical protein